MAFEELHLPFTLYGFLACPVRSTQALAWGRLGVQDIPFWCLADHATVMRKGQRAWYEQKGGQLPLSLLSGQEVELLFR